MSERIDYAHPDITYPSGFRARRGLNWGSIGLMYASYYLCRYNFPIANSKIGTEYGLSNTQMGWIISAAFVAYAVGQMVNGFFTDRIGGRKAMLTGADQLRRSATAIRLLSMSPRDVWTSCFPSRN